MRRVKNRGGREILINPDLITIVEPLPGEQGMVVLHFGRDQKAVVRGTLDDFAGSPAHKPIGLTPDSAGAPWRGECSCGYKTHGWSADYAAQSELDIHTEEAD